MTEVGVVFLALTGLFYNRISKKYQPKSKRQKKTVHYDKRNPEENGSILSRLFFSWVDPLLKLGYRQPLEDSDLYEVPSDHKAHYISQLLQEKWDLQKSREK